VGLGAALRASYRGGRWFESTAAHHDCEYRIGLVPLTEVVFGLKMTTVLTTVLAIRFGRICARTRLLSPVRPRTCSQPRRVSGSATERLPRCSVCLNVRCRERTRNDEQAGLTQSSYDQLRDTPFRVYLR
jgi:hypothetical protein